MGQARTTPSVRTKRRGARGAGADSADRVDADAGVSASQRLDEGAFGEGLDDGQLANPDEAIARYRRLRLKAERALEMLVTAESVPANVRAAAVRTALELVGAIGARSKDQRDQDDRGDELDPETLSIEDIDREIGRLGPV